MKIIQNISFNFLIKVLTYLFSFLILLYATRVLQPAAFGRISFAASVAGYFIMLSNLGMPIYAMRACAGCSNNRKELNTIFHELWSINILLSLIGMAALLSMILLIPKLQENSVLLVIYGSGILFQMLGCEWLFKGLEKFRFLALSMLACKLLSLICIVLFVKSEAHIVLYALFSVFTSYGSNIICFYMLHHYVDISFSIHIRKKHFKPILIFFMMSCAVSIYSSLDLTMIGFMKSDYETGLYSIAAKGKAVLTMFGGLVWASMLPLATRLWKDGNKSRFEALAEKSMAIVCGVQFIVMAICLTFANEIILFVSGESYLGSVTAFRILLLSLVPIGASNILGGQVLIPTGREKKLLQAELMGAVFNFSANWVLIPIFSINGAAFTTVFSEIIVYIACLYYVRRDIKMHLGVEIIFKVIKKIRKVLSQIAIRAHSKARRENLPFYCPCCDTYLEHFVRGSFDKRPDLYNTNRYKDIEQAVICPVCGSLPRHRILTSWLNKNKDWLKGKSILHFAQEKSIRLWMNRNQIKCTTADLYAPADLKINIENIYLDDASYDVIICNHVLEHVTDYKKALRELSRIIRSDGKIIISFPVDIAFETVSENSNITTNAGRIEHFGQYDHQRIFGKDSFALLEKAGFEVSEIKGEECENNIKPVIGPADYDYNILWCLSKPTVSKLQEAMTTS